MNKKNVHYGYWVDVTGIKFEENGTSQWIHAMPLGDWKHPVYGKISFTLQRLQEFTANVNQGVRGQDLDIDYDHKALRTDAAGWVKQAETRSNGLWLLVDWTTEAAKAIKDKAFRYFSPDFQDEWEHPKTGRKIKNVLFGGGITNRPFLKDMIPLNLHELCTDNDSAGGGMNRAFLETTAKGLRVQFNDDTSDEDLQTAITEAAAVAATQGDEGASDDKDDKKDEDDKTEEEETPPPTDLETQLSEAAKKDPLLAAVLQQNKALEAQNKTLGERVGHLETANRLETNNRKLGELRTGKRQLSPASEKKLSEALAGLPADKADTLLEATKTILGEGGIVELQEQGRTGGGGGSDNESYQDAAEFDKAVNKQLSEAKNRGEEIDYLEATLRASTADPALYEAYRAASYTEDSAK